MRLRKRAVAAVFVATAAFASLAAPAMAAPMPWETSKTPTSTTHHTASTAAGDKLASAKVFGVERGPLNGVAPGAWLSVYKALGPQGGYSSDLAAAAEQAILHDNGARLLQLSR